MKPKTRDRDRGQVQLVDIIIGFIMLVVIVVTWPWWNQFIGMVAPVADPFSSLLLQLTLPVLVIALTVSLARSARRGTT